MKTYQIEILRTVTLVSTVEVQADSRNEAVDLAFRVQADEEYIRSTSEQVTFAIEIDTASEKS